MHQLLIFISLMISAKTTSFQRYSSLDIAIPSNILKIDPIRNNQYAFWYANNIISIRGPFPTLAQQFNISLADYLGGIGFYPTQIKTDLDGNVMVGAYLQSICWVNFLTNQTGCIYDATTSVTSVSIINDFQFIDKFMNVVIGTNKNTYLIANLLTGTINLYNISFTFLSFVNFRNKIYGVTNSSFIYVMDLNSSNINYRIFISCLNISNFDNVFQKKILKGFYLNGIQFLGMLRPATLYVFKISLGYFANFALGGSYVGTDFQPIDGTIILSSSGVINQYQMYLAQTNLYWQNCLTSLFIVSKQIFISSSQIYFLLYPKNSPNSSFIQVYKINQGISSCSTLSNVPNCKYCNLPSGSSCSFCQYGYYLNISTCSITGCQLYQKFNSGVCQQVCGITQVYDEQTNRCICPNSFVFNQYLNICQSLCDDVNCVSCYISSYCYQCNVGYSLNQTGQCVTINNSTLQPPTNTTNTTNTSCQAFNCILCESTNLSKCILCSDQTIFYLNSNGQCLQKLLNPFMNQYTKNSLQFSDFIFNIFSIPPVFRIPLQKNVIVAIDDFWISNYHSNPYGPKVNQIFNLIQLIQNKKKAIFQFDQKLNIQLNPYSIGFSNYSNYSNPYFLQAEGKSSTFIESLMNFFVFTTPITLIFFLIFRLIFQLTFKYRISRHFRKYSLRAFIFTFLIQGNFQYMCYCCFNQSRLLFFFNFIDKLNGLLYALFFFSLTIIAFGFYWMMFWFYLKLSKLFIEQVYRIFPSFTFCTSINLGKEFITAAIHCFLVNHYKIQLLCLNAIHFLLILSILYFQIRYGIFRQALAMNLMIIQAFVKILLNFLFLIQYQLSTDDILSYNQLQDSLIVLFYVWALVILFQIISSFVPETILQKKQKSKKTILHAIKKNTANSIAKNQYNNYKKSHQKLQDLKKQNNQIKKNKLNVLRSQSQQQATQITVQSMLNLKRSYILNKFIQKQKRHQQESKKMWKQFNKINIYQKQKVIFETEKQSKQRKNQNSQLSKNQQKNSHFKVISHPNFGKIEKTQKSLKLKNKPLQIKFYKLDENQDLVQIQLN